MSAAERPWWASDVGVGDDGDDPVTAHRRARRGPADAETDDRVGWEHGTDICGVCPICVGLRVLGDARPELVGHLTEAARHLALAVRTVVDAAADAGQAAPPDGDDRLRRIDLD